MARLRAPIEGGAEGRQCPQVGARVAKTTSVTSKVFKLVATSPYCASAASVSTSPK